MSIELKMISQMCFFLNGNSTQRFYVVFVNFCTKLKKEQHKEETRGNQSEFPVCCILSYCKKTFSN